MMEHEAAPEQATVLTTRTPQIGTEQIRQATEILRRYRGGKENLENRIIRNEQFWKMRHWDAFRESQMAEASSGWLVNVILNRHADAMDNYPMPNCLPRAADDQEEARRLSKMLPVILEQNEFKRVYSEVWWYKLKSGCGVYGVFWDADKLGGMGDVDIRKCDILNLFWEPGVTDIQKSRNIFHVELVNREALEEEYPDVRGKLQGDVNTVKKYVYEDSVDVSGKIAVVDWYYKRKSGGRQVVHFVKFAGTQVLYATENDPELRERGLYDHGKYPFVFDVLYPEEGMPCGFGFVDICANSQKQIDRMNRAFMENTEAAATPRFFVRDDGSVNEEEFANFRKPFIHTRGNLGEDSIRPITAPQLGGNYLSYLQMKVQEMRETSGNTESATGVAPSSNMAASAIAALQEASGKLSRDMIQGSYDAERQIVLLVIDLIRQFYDLPRTFRITGEMGKEEFVPYDNRELVPQPVIGADGATVGYRTPVFDIEVVPQRQSEYTKEAANSMSMQLFGAGMFNPELADQALVALQMMDFHGKDEVQRHVAQNGQLLQQVAALQQQVLQLSQIVDATRGTQLAPSVAESITGSTTANAPAEAGRAWEEKTGGSAITDKARAKTQSAASPR